MFDLRAKVALVAGGAGYLGLPVCKKLAEQGAAIVLADINDRQITTAINEIRSSVPAARLMGTVMDIGDESVVKNTLNRTVQEFGRFDILVNMTYKSTNKLLEDMSGDELDAANHVNITGSFFLAREAGRIMPPGSSIIVFVSMYGQVAPDPRIYRPPMCPNPIEYGMGKAALIQMVKYLAVYWGPRGIRVNAVAPGPFPNTHAQKDNPDFIGRLAEKVPLGRIGQKEEIAGAVVFLASDDASYVTGQTIAVNGGWTAW